MYKEVLRATCQTAWLSPNTRRDHGLPPRATPEQRLRAFVHSFLLRIFSEGPSARHGKLMAREMIEPTGALDEIVRENIRPMSLVLKAIITDLLGRKADDKTTRLCAMSVVSQVLFYHHCRPVVTRLFPAMKFDAAGAVDELAGTHHAVFVGGDPRTWRQKRPVTILCITLP